MEAIEIKIKCTRCGTVMEHSYLDYTTFRIHFADDFGFYRIGDWEHRLCDDCKVKYEKFMNKTQTEATKGRKNFLDSI